jgi:gas vesicle protein
MADAETVDRIVQQTLQALDHAKNTDLHTRVALIESQLQLTGKTIDSLASLIHDNSMEQKAATNRLTEKLDLVSQQLSEVFQEAISSITPQIDDLRNKVGMSGKMDLKALLPYIGSVATLVGGFWGVAIRPISLEQEHLKQDITHLRQTIQIADTRLTEHEKLVTHSGTKMIFDTVNKQLDELRSKVDKASGTP